MSVKVKICGIRSVESARIAIEAGADFIGLNFVLSSGKYIMQDEAKKIIEKFRDKTTIVGVFKNQKLDIVNKYIKKLDLEFVQLHGEEDFAYFMEVKAKIIKTIRFLPYETLDELIINTMCNFPAYHFLLDRTKQGEGEMVNMKKAAILAKKFPIFLAGGLNPDNITSIIKKVKPFAVDVAGGIETDGKEDLEKIIEFISRVKGVTL